MGIAFGPVVKQLRRTTLRPQKDRTTQPDRKETDCLRVGDGRTVEVVTQSGGIQNCALEDQYVPSSEEDQWNRITYLKGVFGTRKGRFGLGLGPNLVSQLEAE